jgi:hypothetical protein
MDNNLAILLEHYNSFDFFESPNMQDFNTTELPSFPAETSSSEEPCFTSEPCMASTASTLPYVQTLPMDNNPSILLGRDNGFDFECPDMQAFMEAFSTAKLPSFPAETSSSEEPDFTSGHGASTLLTPTQPLPDIFPPPLQYHLALDSPHPIAQRADTDEYGVPFLPLDHPTFNELSEGNDLPWPDLQDVGRNFAQHPICEEGRYHPTPKGKGKGQSIIWLFRGHS